MTRIHRIARSLTIFACGMAGATLLGCAVLFIVLFERGLAARGAAR
jgi:hypothetical protein